MNQHEARLARTLEQAGAKNRIRPRTVQEELEPVFLLLRDDDPPPTVAAKALFVMCTTDGCYNRKAWAMSGIMTFIEQTPAPKFVAVLEQDYRQFLDELRAIMADACTVEKLNQWIKQWFQ